MSDFMPSPSSWMRLGEAQAGLLETIYDKLNRAEASAQYRDAYEALRKGTIDFNNSLLTDPEHDKYMDKWNRQKTTLWNAATKMTKNQDALNALSDTWSNIDVEQYKTIAGLQTRARMQDTYNRAVASEGAIMKDGSRSNDDRKAAIRKVWSPLIAAGIVSQDQVNQYYSADDKQIDMNAAEEGIRKLSKSQGWDKAISVVDEEGFTQFFPTLTVDDRDALRRKMQSQQLFEEGQAAKRNAQQLAKVDQNLNTALGNYIDGKPGALSVDLIQAQDFPQTTEGQNRRSEWLRYLNTMQRERENRPLDPGVDVALNRLVTDPEMSIAAKQSLILQGGEKGTIPKKYVKQFLSMATEEKFNPYWRDFLGEVSAMTKRPPDGSDPVLSPTQAKTVMEDVRRLMQQQPDMPVTELKHRGEELVKLETDKSIRNNVQARFDAMRKGDFKDWLSVPDIHALSDSMNKSFIQDYKREMKKNPVATTFDENGQVIVFDGKEYWRAQLTHGRISWYHAPQGQENDPSAWKLKDPGFARRALGGAPFSVGNE